MSKRRDDEREEAEVKRLLATLAETRTNVPAADAVFWRAQARLALDEARRRRREALRPLRLFHLAIGAGAIVVAALLAVWPLFTSAPLGGAELVFFPLLIVMVASGARLLGEVDMDRTLSGPPDS